MKIKGFLLNQNPIFFEGNPYIFKNSPTIRIEKLWSMCNRNFSEVANKNYPKVIQSVFSLPANALHAYRDYASFDDL